MLRQNGNGSPLTTLPVLHDRRTRTRVRHLVFGVGKPGRTAHIVCATVGLRQFPKRILLCTEGIRDRLIRFTHIYQAIPGFSHSFRFQPFIQGDQGRLDDEITDEYAVAIANHGIVDDSLSDSAQEGLGWFGVAGLAHGSEV